MAFNRRPDRQITDLRTEEDLRKLNDGYTDNRRDMYNAMLNLILKHKVELQKIPATSALESAQIWAAKRGLRAGEQDLDRDGHPETIVYNKAGKPWIINGYKLKASDYPTRRAFYSAFPTAEERAGERMSDWIIDQAYDVRVDPNNPWRQHVSNTQFGDQLKTWGYRMPTKPKKKQTVFNIFCKLVAPVLREYYEASEGYPATFFGDGAGANSVALFKKIVSPISIYRMLYLKLVERIYFFFTRESRPEYANMSYAQFKQYIKNYENVFYSWFRTNYLDQTQKQFKPGRITPLVIQGAFVKDGVQWDGSDPDDAVVFMFGIENMAGDLADIIRNNGASGQFLEDLKDKKSPNYKQNTKALAKWKKAAAASQKQFFKDQIQYLFENDGALQRYQEAIENGFNPLAATTEQAVEEAQQIPASPMRQPTAQQVAQDEAERNGTYAPPPPEIPITDEMRREADEVNQQANQVALPDSDNDFDA